MARVVLAMSGGVDSSVSAHLLRAAGHEVIGLFMRHGASSPASCATGDADHGGVPSLSAERHGVRSLQIVSPGHKQGCCSASDAADARRVADRLDIPFYAVDFAAEFGRIMDYFTHEYTAGRTPNPCVMCNNWLKFGKLRDYAESVGAEWIATGHYARLEPSGRAGEPPALRRGIDESKDQSYVLFGIDRGVLPRVMFPVGGYRKEQIRDIARQLGLRVAEKKDSQEICFVPDGDYARFVRTRQGRGDLSGEIVTTGGEVVGRHEGIEQFTIGQRKGLGLAFGEPRYVVRLEADTRRVVIGRQEELLRSELTAMQANWLVDPPRQPLECDVKIRYRSTTTPATVSLLGDGRMHVQLREPRAGVAPGQAVVCYAGDRVLGGGWIE
ncbi:MAG TPA: tRNA 2-thiouridine(34) synthase MnmA [Pirellulales bacterium]|nr:tRNA 2-thiouridine(34) synthase MnmA [Pirellulales bacterium]